jgi:very-short-patch-repair endonuclease
MKRKRIIPYNPELKELARYVRKNSTFAEVLLWKHLKSKRMCGLDFDQQKPIGDCIVDFFCHELMFAIDIDGGSHDSKGNSDVERQQRLEAFGVHFLRFRDLDVKNNLAGVLQAIENWIGERKPTCS